MESRHRKVGHAPTRDSACNTSHRRRVARGGAGMAVFRRGFLRPVDRSPAPRNLRFPAGEELAGKSHQRRGDAPAGKSHRRRGDPMAAAAAEGSRRKIK